MTKQPLDIKTAFQLDPAVLRGLTDSQGGIAQIAQAVQANLQGITKAFQESWAPMLIQFAELAETAKRFEKEAPPRVLAVQKHFASLGWHASDLIPFSAFTTLSPNSTPEEVDSFFLAFHAQEIQSIQHAISELFPSRKALLDVAFEAHHERRFDLAIPVFLAQADGIVVDSLGRDVKIFTSDKRKLKRQWSELESLPLSLLTRAMVDVVRQGLPMGAGEFRSNFPHCLNRNAILHGEDLDYGTEINSHKAISLLAFVATTMPDIARAMSEVRETARPKTDERDPAQG